MIPLVPLTGGSGATGVAASAAVPPGLSFHATALSLDLSGGVVAIGGIADLVPVSVP